MASTTGEAEAPRRLILKLSPRKKPTLKLNFQAKPTTPPPPPAKVTKKPKAPSKPCKLTKAAATTLQALHHLATTTQPEGCGLCCNSFDQKVRKPYSCPNAQCPQWYCLPCKGEVLKRDYKCPYCQQELEVEGRYRNKRSKWWSPSFEELEEMRVSAVNA